MAKLDLGSAILFVTAVSLWYGRRPILKGLKVLGDFTEFSPGPNGSSAVSSAQHSIEQSVGSFESLSVPQRVAITFSGAAYLISLVMYPVTYRIGYAFPIFLIRFGIWAIFPRVYQDHDGRVQKLCQQDARSLAVLLMADAFLHLVHAQELYFMPMLWGLVVGLNEFRKSLSKEGLIALAAIFFTVGKFGGAITYLGGLVVSAMGYLWWWRETNSQNPPTVKISNSADSVVEHPSPKPSNYKHNQDTGKISNSADNVAEKLSQKPFTSKLLVGAAGIVFAGIWAGLISMVLVIAGIFSLLSSPCANGSGHGW